MQNVFFISPPLGVSPVYETGVSAAYQVHEGVFKAYFTLYRGARVALGKLTRMNDYIERLFELLSHRDPITVLETTPQRLEGYLLGFFEPDFERSYAPGKWTAREILAHLADVELALGFRLRQAVAEERYRPQPFDQDLWAQRYARLEPSLAAETFRALRAWNLALLTTFDLQD